MHTLTAEEAKDKLIRIIEDANLENEHFTITSDKGNIVAIPEQTYNNILITLELLSTPGLLDKIKNPEVAEDEAEALWSVL